MGLLYFIKVRFCHCKLLLLFLGTVTDLYVDYHKLKAVNVKTRVPKLLDVLERNNFDELLDFFHLTVLPKD